MAGYSGTPLAKKLGIKPGDALYTKNAPPHYRELLAPLPAGVTFVTCASLGLRIAHGFFVERARLERELIALQSLLAPDGVIWISWPKKSAKIATDITEDSIRAVALPMGLVDVKVCAVDETWSALKLVIRLANRGKSNAPNANT